MPVHLALEGLEPVDLSFGLAVAPGQHHATAHGVVVSPQALGEAPQLADDAVSGVVQKPAFLGT